MITLQGSEDNLNWYDLPGGVLNGVASATVMVNIVNVRPKFVRGRVSTAGVGVTAGWVLTLKAVEG